MAIAASLIGFLLLVILFLWLKPRKGTNSSGGRRKGPAAGPGTGQRTAVQGTTAAGGAVEAASSGAAEPELPAREAPAELRAFDLLRAGDLDADARDRVDAMCSAMPDPHPIQAQLVGGLDSPEELKEAVAADAGLTASVLKTVNSAAFALASPITSVQHAITYLGVSAVKGLVVQAAVTERAPEGTPEQQAALERVWKAARVSSALAQLIGQESALSRPSVVGTHALFANLGDVVIAAQVDGTASSYSGDSTLLARIDTQQRLFGANTFIVGSALALHWDLPGSLAAAIEQAGLPLAAAPGEHPLEGDPLRENLIVYTACQVGNAVAYGGLRDIADLALRDSNDPDVFFLPAHLHGADLARLLDLLEDPGFKRKANRLITTLA